MRTLQRERRSTETVDDTEARLQQDRESHRERQSTETADEMEARLQRDRESHREQRALGALSQSQLPLIQQRSVQAKMKKFHTHLATLEVSRCSTCLEAFPGLHLQPGSTECARCGRDMHTPKLYSSGNNVDPGPIPAQVSKMTVFHDITLLHFVRQYSMPKELGSEPSRRRKNVVVIVCTFSLALLSVHAVAETCIPPNCTPVEITWILAPFQHKSQR